MTAHRRTAVRTVLAGLAAAGTLLVAFPGAASAHTTLIAQSPKAGATVKSPKAVTLTFADRVIQPGVVVRGGDGHRVNSSTSVDGPKVTARLPKLQPGRYQVGWRVVAPDGHVQTGEFRFAVPGGNGQVPAATSTEASHASGGGPPAWVWVVIAGVIVLVGGGLVAVRRALR